MTYPTRSCAGRECGAQIIDMTLLRQDGARVRHVFDPEPVAGGKYRFDATLLGTTEAMFDETLEAGYVSHFATCPNSPQFRGDR